METYKKAYHVAVWIWVALCLPLSVFGQGIQTEFGKNRIQYHDFDWQQYETDNFVTYWYTGGKSIGYTVLKMAEMDNVDIQTILEYHINGKIEILVYNDLTDLKQTNVGTEDVFYNTGGVTKIVGNKIFVYFDGNHNHLRKQIREGISRVYLNNMMFGDNLQEIVQNAVLLNLPEWFTEGLVSYVGEKWNTDLDNKLRDGILSGKYSDFSKLVTKEPKFAGHSFWYFIAQSEGSATVSNLLYLTRINRSIESGFLYVLGNSFEQTNKRWLEFYKQRYTKETNQTTAFSEDKLIPIKNKRNLTVSQVKISPNGQQLAYVTNQNGRYKIYLQDLNSEKRTLVYKGGIRNLFQATDKNYPLVTWKRNGRELAVMYEKQDKVKLLIHTVASNKGKHFAIPTQYQRILSIDFVKGKQFVFAGIYNGQSDIFLYNYQTGQTTRITQDFYDDIDAAYVTINGQEGIVFSSNRQDSLLIPMKLDSILPLQSFDLWFYNMTDKSSELVRVTNTPFANEYRPIAIDSTHFAYLSDENGIKNRHLAYINVVFAYNEKVLKLKDGKEIVMHPDSTMDLLDPAVVDSTFLRAVYKPKAFSFANTNYSRNLLEQHSSVRRGRIAELVLNNGEYQIYVQDIKTDKRVEPSLSMFRKQWIGLIPKKEKTNFSVTVENINKPIIEPTIKDTIPPKKATATAKDSAKIDIDNYLFQSEFEDELTEIEKPIESTPTEKPVLAYKPVVQQIKIAPKMPSLKIDGNKVISYRPKFKTDFVTTQLDNSLMFGGYDSYAGNGQLYDYPVPSILLMGGVKDLLEDYRFQGGIRVPTTFDGVEYFLVFNDLKKRLDKRYSYYRRSRKGIDQIQLAPNLIEEPSFKVLTNLFEVQLKWPLDIYRSVRATSLFRTDKFVYQATDIFSLNLPSQNQERLGIRLEYVHDNTRDIATNIKHGTRYKAFVEVQQRFNIDVLNDFAFDLNRGTLFSIGVDARHYFKLDRHSIFAARFATATSFGSEKILYYLGGVDNWLFPSFNGEIPVPESDGFAYQTLASNMRGFRNNIRNGNSYMLSNLELRVPFLKYLSRNPLKSSFLRNLQLVGFFDIGSAWEGLSPFDNDNPLNTDEVGMDPVTVKVNYFRNPIVMGYGAGLRTMLFGYFVRLDYAWGVETEVVQDPVLYISLGMDF